MYVPNMCRFKHSESHSVYVAKWQCTQNLFVFGYESARHITILYQAHCLNFTFFCVCVKIT